MSTFLDKDSFYPHNGYMDMSQNPAPPTPTASSVQSAPVTPAPQQTYSVPPSSRSNPFLTIILVIIALVAGAALTYFFAPSKKKGPSYIPPVTVQNNKVTLPTTAIQIQKCADHKGTLYVEPQNIPVGPVYMVKDGEVIGIEYMLSKEEFLNGKSYKFLNGLGLKVDHVNIGLLSTGHEGYTAPHYHVDIYTVDKNIEEAISCGTPTAAPIPSTTTVPSSQAATLSPTQAATPAATGSAMTH